MKRILFVCTGNACRSAAAEYVLRQLLEKNGVQDVEIDSVGTADCGVNPRDPVMVNVAAQKGYALGGTTEFMTSEKLNAADVLVVMTSRHRDQVTSLLKYAHWNRICLFNEVCFGTQDDVPDPHWATEKVYRDVFDLIERGCVVLADRIAAGNWPE